MKRKIILMLTTFFIFFIFSVFGENIFFNNREKKNEKGFSLEINDRDDNKKDCYLEEWIYSIDLLDDKKIGIQFQCNHHGYDISKDGSSLLVINLANANNLYLYRYHPFIKNEIYSGFGMSCKYKDTSKRLLFELMEDEGNYNFLMSPKFLIGKEFKSADKSHFFQVSVDVPLYDFGGSSTSSRLPKVSFSYGFSF